MSPMVILGTLNRKGFTLLEVLLTVMLMLSSLVFLLQAMSSGLFASAHNELDLIAISLAQEEMEGLRNKIYTEIVNESRAVVSGFPRFEREVKVTTSQTGLKQVNVYVYWFTKTEELNTSLVTYVSDI